MKSYREGSEWAFYLFEKMAFAFSSINNGMKAHVPNFALHIVVTIPE